jgi:uncharacterized membrane protein YgdD (TMEM256/DUF423 family)
LPLEWLQTEGSGMRIWLFLSAVNGAISVVAGAFTAHAMAGAGDRVLDLLEQAAQYQMYHALALALVACLVRLGWGGRWATAAGVLFAVGIVLFCGSLYLIALGGVQAGLFAPFGGAALIAGWLCVACAAIRKEQRRQTEGGAVV